MAQDLQIPARRPIVYAVWTVGFDDNACAQLHGLYATRDLAEATATRLREAVLPVVKYDEVNVEALTVHETDTARG